MKRRKKEESMRKYENAKVFYENFSVIMPAFHDKANSYWDRKLSDCEQKCRIHYVKLTAPTSQ